MNHRKDYRMIWRALALCAGITGLGWMTAPAPAPRLKLSEYGFFQGPLSDLSPAPQVLEYEVNAPLFTDYAEKRRFIYLPPDDQMQWQADAALDFPTGAVIIKNFFYWNHAAHPEQGRRILETRLLLKEEKGWTALTYVWNRDQTDADLEVAGATIPLEWTTAENKKIQLQYVVPNVNQCKGCHSYDGVFVPIGVTVRQLNRVEKGENQLKRWHDSGKLKTPEPLDWAALPALTNYREIRQPEKEDAQRLAGAARSYLEANCAHCHNPHGPASTSGMYLDSGHSDMERLGVGKPPVAAGRGSGNRKFGIVPGKPGESILVYRMENNDPGIRMPELGRQLTHKEGLDLIKAWIRRM